VSGKGFNGTFGEGKFSGFGHSDSFFEFRDFVVLVVLMTEIENRAGIRVLLG